MTEAETTDKNKLCTFLLYCYTYISLQIALQFAYIFLQKTEQNKHKLKHYFYSPNIQSKIIIDSQTSTVKIQLFFLFFFVLDTEGHCLKIVVYPVKFTYCLFITITVCLWFTIYTKSSDDHVS